MLMFFLGLLVGLIVMDTLWAYKVGHIDHLYQKYQVWQLKRRASKL